MASLPFTAIHNLRLEAIGAAGSGGSTDLIRSSRPQFGFISMRGTAEASLLVGETIQWNVRRGLPVFAANLDARK